MLVLLVVPVVQVLALCSAGADAEGGLRPAIRR